MSDGFVTNGIGPEIERIRIHPDMMRVVHVAWSGYVSLSGLRNSDQLSSDRFEFGHAASVELENNVPEAGCWDCVKGVECFRPAHSSGDFTGYIITWTAVSYANVDHMRGGIK